MYPTPQCSRDDQNILLLSYADIRRCVEASFRELLEAESKGKEGEGVGRWSAGGGGGGGASTGPYPTIPAPLRRVTGLSCFIPAP